jgi:hypothetical protein
VSGGSYIASSRALVAHHLPAGTRPRAYAPGTHFFMINDTGTYFPRKLPPAGDATASVFDAETLLARAAEAKVKLLDHRIDVPGGMPNRDFPAYLDSNRFLSNLPGTTIFFPVVDLSRQYINGMMYLLTQPEGARPVIVGDRRFYLPAGVRKWIQSGFLNNDIKLPLGTIWSMRTQIEADLLLQNIMLTADAMGPIFTTPTAGSRRTATPCMRRGCGSRPTTWRKATTRSSSVMG